MFDQEDPAEYDAWLDERAATLDLIDEVEMLVPSPVVTDAEFAAWAAELEGVAVTSRGEGIAGGGGEGGPPGGGGGGGPGGSAGPGGGAGGGGGGGWGRGGEIRA